MLFVHITHFQRTARGLLRAKSTSSQFSSHLCAHFSLDMTFAFLQGGLERFLVLCKNPFILFGPGIEIPVGLRVRLIFVSGVGVSLRTADVFPIVASLPPKSMLVYLR